MELMEEAFLLNKKASQEKNSVTLLGNWSLF